MSRPGIIRSYSLDHDIADLMDSLPDGRGKQVSRSMHVSRALRWYFKEDIKLLLEQRDLLQGELNRVTAQGCRRCLWCRIRSRLKR